jgi:hypothetical protein
MTEDFKNLKGKNAGAFDGIPENYFRELPDRVLETIGEKQNDTKRFFLKPVFIGMAASLMFLIGFAVVMLYNNQSPEDDLLTANGKPFEVNEMIVYNDTTPKDLLDSVKLNGQNHEQATLSDPTEDLDNLFATLDDIPLDVIIEYLIAAEEFSF